MLTALALGLACGILQAAAVLTDDSVAILERGTWIKLFSVACPLVQMAQLVAPMPLVHEAVVTLKADDLPMPVIRSQVVCNVLGASYGIQVANSAVFVTNMFGLGCQITYLCCYHFVVASNAGWIRFVVPHWLLLNMSFHVFTIMLPVPILGHLIIFFNVVLSSAPLMKIGAVLRARSSKALPTGMTVVSCLNNALWTVFSMLLNDLVLLVPSILGFLLTFFQIMVILWCHHVLPFDLSFLLLPCSGSVTAVEVVAGQEACDHA